MSNKRKESLFTGSIIIILIMLAPYLLYIHESIPDNIRVFNSFFGAIDGGENYGEARIYVYFLLSKFVPLFLLIIWFVTNKNWWVHGLIIPISVYLFQFIVVLNDSEQYMMEVEFIYTIPITVIVMVILYFIRSKMAIFIQAVDLKKEMDESMKDTEQLK